VFAVTGHALPNGTEPTIFLDFKNGEYTSDGVTVTIADLLVENADWGEWNAATMISAGVGMTSASAICAPVFTGDAFDLVSAGATIVLTFSGAASGVLSRALRYELVDDLNDYNVNYYSRHSYTEGTLSDIGDQVASNVLDGVLADGAHKSALTYIDGKISRSTDGAAIITINPAAAWSPAPTVMGFIISVTLVLESVGIYPAQPDADLPSLSAL
jgi:hypothetical protein